jgi:GR25 family glycosyltransferase involved in LPS biosynthesis
MQVHCINLDRSTDRLAEFTATNGHLRDVRRFAAVDGASLNVPALVKSKTISAWIAAAYTKGALGCAFSHFALWDEAIENGEARTICEDDAIFNLHFHAASSEVIKSLPVDWDIVLWGWNFDRFLLLDFLPGVCVCQVECDQSEMRKNVGAFQKLSMLPQPFKLRQALGAVCYSISQKGARVLKDLCVPLREIEVYCPGDQNWMTNRGIDIMLSCVYPMVSSFVCFPPLVVTKNDHDTSTTINANR